MSGVLFDAYTGAGHTVDSGGATVTTISNTHLTVGVGTNRGLLAIVSWLGGAPTGVTGVWDPGGANQSLTLIPGASDASGATSMAVALLGLLNPTPGNKTLTISWTSAAEEAFLAAISFSGVDQTSIAAAFPNGAANAGATAASGSTSAITSAVGDMVVALFAQGSAWFVSTSGNTISLGTESTGGMSMAALYQDGAASVTPTADWGGGTIGYGWAACDVKAAGVTIVSPKFRSLRPATMILRR